MPLGVTRQPPILHANTLNEEGEINRQHTAMRTGVCDVGTYTVDLALDDDGEYVDAESGSVESGVYTAHERIGALLERDYRQKIPFKLVEQVVRTGVFRASGEVVDYSKEVEEALATLRSATLNLMSEKWKSGATIDVIYLSGGGAELVAKEVLAAYPKPSLSVSHSLPMHAATCVMRISRSEVAVEPVGAAGLTQFNEKTRE